MVSIKPTQLSNDDTVELFSETGSRQKISNSITNVFSSANRMTQSLVSTATSTTLSVKQTFDNVRAMQKYNEEQEELAMRAAQAMDEERRRR